MDKHNEKDENKDKQEDDNMEAMNELSYSTPFDKMKLFIESILTPKTNSYKDIPKLKQALKKVKLQYNLFIEDDGSYTLSFKDIDIIVNDKTYNKALDLLVSDLKEYSLDYCKDLSYWYSAPNRKSHYKYVVKAILYTDEELKKDLICQNFQN